MKNMKIFPNKFSMLLILLQVDHSILQFLFKCRFSLNLVKVTVIDYIIPVLEWSTEIVQQ